MSVPGPKLDIDSNFHRDDFAFALISEHAKPGFVYRSDRGINIHQILKLDGGKLVRVQNGRWAEM